MVTSDIRVALLELTSLGMQIQDHSNCLVAIELNHCIGVWTIYVSHEYETKINLQNIHYETRVYYGDDWWVQGFEKKFKQVKEELLDIYQKIDKIE